MKLVNFIIVPAAVRGDVEMKVGALIKSLIDTSPPRASLSVFS